MNIKIKKKIQKKIVKCFEELQKIEGIKMSPLNPMCHIESDKVYEMGNPFPTVSQYFYVDFKLYLDEDCIEVNL